MRPAMAHGHCFLTEVEGLGRWGRGREGLAMPQSLRWGACFEVEGEQVHRGVDLWLGRGSTKPISPLEKPLMVLRPL